MPAASAEPHLLLDTSVAVAFVVSDHTAHSAVFSALAGLPLGLAGHAAFESFSVLTRLPPPQRLTPAAVARALSANFPHTRFLSDQRSRELLGQLPALGVAGGSVYDALVGAAALEHDLELVSRDQRAADTYSRLGVRVRLLT